MIRALQELLETTPFLALLFAVVLLTLLAVVARRFWVHRFQAWYRRHFLAASVGGLILLFVLVAVFPYLFFTMGPGEAGVVWSRFFGGTDTGAPKPEGTFIKLPWDRAYIYDVRYRRATRSLDAITIEGLQIQVTVAVRYRPIEAKVGQLHKEIGPEYVDRLLLPEVEAFARHVLAAHTAEEIYGTERQEIETEIFRGMIDALPIRALRELSARSVEFLELEDLLILSVTLPPRVAGAIEGKIEQFHLNEEYRYRLARERNEMLRKGIEGEGIALFQSKVSNGISDRYLRWKGIEATLRLAQSENSKIVVIGAGEDGLPLILGGFESPAGGSGGGAVGAPSAAAGDDGSFERADALLQQFLEGDNPDTELLLDESMREAMERFLDADTRFGRPDPEREGDSTLPPPSLPDSPRRQPPGR